MSMLFNAGHEDSSFNGPLCYFLIIYKYDKVSNGLATVKTSELHTLLSAHCHFYTRKHLLIVVFLSLEPTWLVSLSHGRAPYQMNTYELQVILAAMSAKCWWFFLLSSRSLPQHLCPEGKGEEGMFPEHLPPSDTAPAVGFTNMSHRACFGPRALSHVFFLENLFSSRGDEDLKYPVSE